MPIVSTSFVLARPGTPSNSAWPPQYSNESLLDDLVLAEDDGADRRLGGAGVRGSRLGRTHDHVFELFEPLSASNGHS